MSLKSMLFKIGKSIVTDYMRNRGNSGSQSSRGGYGSGSSNSGALGGIQSTIEQVLGGLSGNTNSGSRGAGQNGERAGGSTVLASETPGRYGSTATRDLSAAELSRIRTGYAPNPDGDPDPGEVVWTWVPYAENDGRGKDRPVLVLGRIDDTSVAACYLSSKYHQGFAAIGRGGWDPQNRDSYLNPERLLRVTTHGMRREGDLVTLQQYQQALQAVSAVHGRNL